MLILYLTRVHCILFYSIGDKKMRNLIKHCQEEGLTPRVKRRGGRKSNTKALTLEDTKYVVTYIQNHAEVNAVSLPGRVPGYKRDDILLLPSSTTKREIHSIYQATCQAKSMHSFF